MCRMFAYVGTSHREIKSLHTALKEASRKNEVGQEVGLQNACSDGWGYVIVNGTDIMHHRSITPIFEDDHRIPVTTGKTYAIFHARRASDLSKVEKSFTHPFDGSNERDLTFLAHNGRVTMDRQANPGIIDTEFALKVILEKGLEEGVRHLGPLTENALNLLVLQINRLTEQPSLQFLNFYTDPSEGNYFDMFYTRMRNGVAVVSSTLPEFGIRAEGKVPYDKLVDIENL